MDAGSPQSMTIAQAAKHFSVTTAAIRKRIRRGSLHADKNADGTWTVYVPEGEPVHARAQTDSMDGSVPRDEVVSLLRDEVSFLRRELEQRAEELRRKDVIIASFADRLPELPTPSNQEATPTMRLSDPVSRPWWKLWAVD